MAGTFPGVSGTQQQDLNGDPLELGILSVFNGGTNTLSSTFQDIGLAIPAANPLIADLSGRIPLFFVADGTYRVRLTDQFGSTTNGGFDYPLCPSIGASSSGGGGSAVDPTTVFSTGDIKAQLIDGVISGWVRVNGRTIGSSTSGSSERASADTAALFAYIWNNFSDTQCPVPSGRGISAVADFAANKQITLPDLRGRAIFGLDTMGNAAASRLLGATFLTGSSSAYGSTGGEGAHLLLTNEIPAHTHTTTVTDPGHAHNVNGGASATVGFPSGACPAGSGNPQCGSTSVTINTATTGITVAVNSAGGGGTHNTMPPFMLGTIFMKL